MNDRLRALVTPEMRAVGGGVSKAAFYGRRLSRAEYYTPKGVCVGEVSAVLRGKSAEMLLGSHTHGGKVVKSPCDQCL